MAATRIFIKVKDIKDPKEELNIALSKFKKKVKETGLLSEFILKSYFRRPALRRKEKAERSLRRRRKQARRS